MADDDANDAQAQAFAKYAGPDNVLTHAELQSMLVDLGFAGADDAYVRSLMGSFGRFDGDHDGLISLEEFGAVYDFLTPSHKEDGGAGAAGAGTAGTLLGTVPAYDPTEFASLRVSQEIDKLFEHIAHFRAHHIELDTRLKPFIPGYIPAVGDVDACIKARQDTSHRVLFLCCVRRGRCCAHATNAAAAAGVAQVPRPDGQLEATHAQLGLGILDEPAASQTDPTGRRCDLKTLCVPRGCASSSES